MASATALGCGSVVLIPVPPTAGRVCRPNGSCVCGSRSMRACGSGAAKPGDTCHVKTELHRGHRRNRPDAASLTSLQSPPAPWVTDCCILQPTSYLNGISFAPQPVAARLVLTIACQKSSSQLRSSIDQPGKNGRMCVMHAAKVLDAMAGTITHSGPARSLRCDTHSPALDARQNTYMAAARRSAAFDSHAASPCASPVAARHGKQ